ncbi:uncharacterized protein BDZ99DRAFT_514166 [Mytilinidion resinicola]|uniref:Uncharacterized protein n=1 Tax=Mytilinidion resinicola TaxID=574789 RepID=A0A6A6ZAA2_9PEZI|nr:uncharacterized protein BDZ99DRAFT_514166 [Mytilinidion resinicola]KAF2817946.1 hypothetical protein BDZ99DRAFT_514166 [Mytilinidion resinicola]
MADRPKRNAQKPQRLIEELSKDRGSATPKPGTPKTAPAIKQTKRKKATAKVDLWQDHRLHVGVSDAKAEKKKSALVLDKTKGFMKYQRVLLEEKAKEEGIPATDPTWKPGSGGSRAVVEWHTTHLIALVRVFMVVFMVSFIVQFCIQFTILKTLLLPALHRPASSAITNITTIITTNNRKKTAKMGQNNSKTTTTAAAAPLAAPAAVLAALSPGPVTAPPRAVVRLLRPAQPTTTPPTVAYAFGGGFTALDAETRQPADRTNAECRAWASAAVMAANKREIWKAKWETWYWLEHGDEEAERREQEEERREGERMRRMIETHWPDRGERRGGKGWW